LPIGSIGDETCPLAKLGIAICNNITVDNPILISFFLNHKKTPFICSYYINE